MVKGEQGSLPTIRYMKALLINTFYNQESTGKLIHNFHSFLKKNNDEVLVLYGHGIHNPADSSLIRLSSDLEGKIHNLLGRITGLNGCFSFFSTAKALKYIDEFKPDAVFLGNLHGHYVNIYQLFEHLKLRNIPIIQIMWDEYMMTGACSFSYECERFQDKCFNCPHKKDYPISWFFDTSSVLQTKKRKAYENQNICFVSVPYTIEKGRRSALIKHFTLYSLDEAVDQTTIFFPHNGEKLRQELGIPAGKKIVLNVCPYPSERKGGRYYLELARSCLDLEQIVFVHVGFNGDTSICPRNYLPIGYVKDQQRLAAFYSMADLFICTSLAETQPNTCLEALSCGTPICGFNISGVPTCASSPYGKYVELGDIQGLRNIVVETPKKTKQSESEIRSYAETRFSSDDYNRRLREIALSRINVNTEKHTNQ